MAPRVLILSSQTLFAESLVGLLEDQGYQVVAVQPYDDDALAHIADEQPSIVVLDTRGAPPSVASALLDCAPDLRVIEVSLDSPVIAMYHRRESAATAQNFLELIASADMQPSGDERGPSNDGNSTNSPKL